MAHVEVYHSGERLLDYVLTHDVHKVGTRLPCMTVAMGPDLEIGPVCCVQQHALRIARIGSVWHAAAISRRRTWINGEVMVHDHMYNLADGDEVAIGRVKLVFRNKKETVNA